MASGRFIYFLLSPLVRHHHHTPVTTGPIIWRYLFNIILWILQNQMTIQALLFLGHLSNWCQSSVSIYQFTLKVSWLISGIMSPSAFSLQQRVRKYDHLISIFTSRAPCCHTLLKMFYVKNIHYKLRCYKC